jgi:transcriptional regulator with PAS, ATPase and Fis domain
VATRGSSTIVDGGRSRAGGSGGRHLVVMGPAVFKTVALPARGALVIGRGSGADVDIDEPRASRRHARLSVGDALTIEDLGSANGTRVRGKKLAAGEPTAIAPGEAVSIGALVLMVQQDRAATSTAAPAAPPHPPEQDDALTIPSVDPAMEGVYALARRAATGTIGVVILGETGVGKEVLARAIHEGSPRFEAPFVSLNCAALSESLLESELFGHEKGAFTGAAQAKEGLLETAPGGTVFLDEVGELPLALQAKLLRVIEARELVRVGGVRARKIDVRFLAATNRDLEAEVARGAFRADLYYRLNGMTLTIPPLRERPADVPVLARHFTSTLAHGAGHAHAPQLTDEALAALAAHDWPGNVRELRNVIERALLVTEHGAIGPAQLALPKRAAPARKRGDSRAPVSTAPASEKERIRAALAACAGNQSRAAKELGISRKVLLARLDKYGLVRPRKKTST